MDATPTTTTRSSRPRRRPVVATVLAAVLMLTGFGLLAQPAGALPRDTLSSGATLSPGQQLTSTTGVYRLVMQGDGNLVFYGPGNQVIWHAGTNGHPGAVARMQTDGNLVVIAPGNRPVWNAGTHGNHGAYLRLQNDRNLVVYARGERALWHTRTNTSVAPRGPGGCRYDTFGTFTEFLTNAKCVPPGFPHRVVQDRNARGELRMMVIGDYCTISPDTGLHFDFKKACAVHDYMYALLRHFGQADEGRFGDQREKADAIFKTEMYADCNRRGGAAGVLCRRTADSYYLAVADQGDTFIAKGPARVLGGIRLL